MNLKSLGDKSILKEIEKLVVSERELLTVILHHLREIDRRKLFSSLGYKSLFDFAHRHLRYPEDQAYRRVSAMKLLRELPEIEEKINQGEINLTHISLAQTLFKQEKKVKELTHEQKLFVIDQLSNTSVREAEKITLSLSSKPKSFKVDKIVNASESSIEIRFIANATIRAKIDKLKGQLAHKSPNITLGELFEKLCDLGLEEFSPSRKFAAPRKRRVILSKAQTHSEVFSKANNRCENCGSTYALEIDHIKPRAFGGSDKIENLRVLCKPCNQRAAIVHFGLTKMDPYLS